MAKQMARASGLMIGSQYAGRGPKNGIDNDRHRGHAVVRADLHPTALRGCCPLVLACLIDEQMSHAFNEWLAYMCCAYWRNSVAASAVFGVCSIPLSGKRLPASVLGTHASWPYCNASMSATEHVDDETPPVCLWRVPPQDNVVCCLLTSRYP